MRSQRCEIRSYGAFDKRNQPCESINDKDLHGSKTVFSSSSPDFFWSESSTHNLFKKEVNTFEDHVKFLGILGTF